ncbi:MAG: TonB family protein [Flavobacterium sp.]|mgnify:CR=1 FL=1|jgi:periplasmic protein TonB|nr:TonB family protein [Flavobacterium sp.]
MEVKKNPNVDPKRNSSLYFLVGLTAVLILTYVSIELKSEDPRTVVEKIEIVDNMMGDEEEVILTMPPAQKLPPPPPPAPEVIQVVDNKQIIEDKKIETTEVNENKPVVVAQTSSNYGDEGGTAEEIDEELPFAVIEDAPIFPGCENVPKNQRSACFEEQIRKFVGKNQQYPEKAMEDNIQGRVSVVFVIDKDGSITNVQARGPKGGELLEKEALRVISKLPKIKPGLQRGKPVKIKFSIPFVFRLQ